MNSEDAVNRLVGNIFFRLDELDHRMDQFATALQKPLSRTAHLESPTVAAPVQPMLQSDPAAAPVSVQAPASSITSIRVIQKDKPKVSVTLSWAESSIEIQALINSGAAGLFIDAAFVSKHSIPLQLHDTPLAIEALDGRPLQPAHVTHETVPLSMAVGALHQEIIQFQ
ncbi:hypothetical protein AB205_0077930, partial [Aquarana catesbeiana]